MSKRKFTEEEKEAFRVFADAHAPKSRLFADCLRAFLTGGAICTAGQLIYDGYILLGANADTAKTLLPITLIFISCLLTGLGLYEKLASFAGAGTLLPITGFANAVCSSAIDGKPEGYILGVASKMFGIAGPVIVYGTAASVVYGFVYWCLSGLAA